MKEAVFIILCFGILIGLWVRTRMRLNRLIESSVTRYAKGDSQYLKNLFLKRKFGELRDRALIITLNVAYEMGDKDMLQFLVSEQSTPLKFGEGLSHRISRGFFHMKREVVIEQKKIILRSFSKWDPPFRPHLDLSEQQINKILNGASS